MKTVDVPEAGGQRGVVYSDLKQFLQIYAIHIYSYFQLIGN